jgi:hypothetical protein
MQAAGVQPHRPAVMPVVLHWQSVFSAHAAGAAHESAPPLHMQGAAMVQKLVPGKKAALHTVAILLPVHSVPAVVQYLPMPTELPVSPGLPHSGVMSGDDMVMSGGVVMSALFEVSPQPTINRARQASVRMRRC